MSKSWFVDFFCSPIFSSCECMCYVCTEHGIQLAIITINNMDSSFLFVSSYSRALSINCEKVETLCSRKVNTKRL